MSSADKTKLDGIASGAEVNAQSDWNVTDTASDAFIKNKPTAMPASDVSAWAKAATKPTYTAAETGAAASSHTHTIANVTNLQSALDGKAASSHTHTKAQISDFPGNATASVAGLMSPADKTKLDGIAAGAGTGGGAVQSDWNVADTASDSFIKNKPTIPKLYYQAAPPATANVGDIFISSE